MSLFTKLARNSFWLLLARLGAQSSMVLVTYLLARRLGTAGFGEYAFLTASLAIGNTLTTFGSDMVLIREIAAKSDFSALPSVLMLQLVLSILFIGCVFLLAPFLPNQTPESLLALKVYSLALIPLAFFTLFTSMLRGAQKMISYAWLNFLVPAAQAIAIFVFIQRGTAIVTLAYLLLCIQTLATVLGGVFCARLFPGFWQGLSFSWDMFESLFVACLPIALIAIVGIVYQKLSLTMLSFLGTASMVGLFSAAARVIEAARMGHVAACTALYPAMANTDRDTLSHGTIRLSWILLLAISIAGSILLFLLAKPIVELVFGAEYRSSISVLKVLAFTLIPFTVNSFLSLLFLAKKKEKIVMRVLTVSVIMLLTLNFWLIPHAGQVGASWAILITEITQAVLFLLAWLNSPLRQIDNVHTQGVSYELSDLS
jgi:O-antigen/teichoic acid export membrane protein